MFDARHAAILCLPSLFMSAPPALAGAWTQPAGEGLVILSLDYSLANSGFDDGGQAVSAQDFRKIELRGYLEYGLTDWATLVAQPEWRDKRTGPSQGESVNGLGRIDTGARLRLWQGDASVISVQGTARIPGASDPIAPANGGDTDWEADARVLYGRGFSALGRSGFADVQAGYRVRLGDPADELRLDLTTGLNVTPKIMALLQSFNSVSVGSASLPLLPTREHKVAASVVYDLDDAWSVQVGGLANVAGRNTLQEYGGIVGIWRKF